MRGRLRSGAVVAAPAVVVVVALALVGVALGSGTPLKGKVGPGFTISLQDASGSAVTHLDPGSYELTVDDLSDEHSFHLQGPGVNVSTEVAEQGTKTFQLSLVDGMYSFFCDAHPLTMKGKFTVGTPPPPPPLPKLTLTVTDR